MTPKRLDHAEALSASSRSGRRLTAMVDLFAQKRWLASHVAEEDAKRWGLLAETQKLRAESARARQSAAEQATATLSTIIRLEEGLERAETACKGLEQQIDSLRKENAALAEQKNRGRGESEESVALRRRIAEEMTLARSAKEENRRQRRDFEEKVRQRTDELAHHLATQERELQRRLEETAKGAAIASERKEEARRLLAQAEADLLVRRQAAADETLVLVRTQHHHALSAARARLADLLGQREELNTAIAQGRGVVEGAESKLKSELEHQAVVAGVAAESAEETRRDASCLSAELDGLRHRVHSLREEEGRLLLQEERLLNGFMAVNAHGQQQVTALKAANTQAVEGRRQLLTLATRHIHSASKELSAAKSRLAFEQKRMDSLLRLREDLQRKISVALTLQQAGT